MFIGAGYLRIGDVFTRVHYAQRREVAEVQVFVLKL
jgi:hypothetical protein